MANWNVGDAKITKVVETEQRWPFKALLPGAEELVDAHEWLRPDFVTDDGRMKLSIHSLVVESSGQTIVVDTCAGNGKARPGAPAFDELQTDFLADFAAAGFDPAAVDTVVCTHLHVDHVGWNTMLDGDVWRPTFPNARYLFGETEWDHWRVEPQTYGDVVGDSVQPVIDAGRAELVASDLVLNDLVTLEPTPGHTPGHHSVRISSDGEDAIITGDIFHAAVQLEHPEWASAPDVDAARAAATRRSFLERYCDDHTLVLATHLGGPGCGHLRAHGDGWRLDPNSVTGA